jgi:hypothetical protein
MKALSELSPSLPPNCQDDRTRICNLGNPNPALYQLSHALLFFLLSSRRASMLIPTEAQMKFWGKVYQTRQRPSPPVISLFPLQGKEEPKEEVEPRS